MCSRATFPLVRQVARPGSPQRRSPGGPPAVASAVPKASIEANVTRTGRAPATTTVGSGRGKGNHGIIVAPGPGSPYHSGRSSLPARQQRQPPAQPVLQKAPPPAQQQPEALQKPSVQKRAMSPPAVSSQSLKQQTTRSSLGRPSSARTALSPPPRQAGGPSSLTAPSTRLHQSQPQQRQPQTHRPSQQQAPPPQQQQPEQRQAQQPPRQQAQQLSHTRQPQPQTSQTSLVSSVKKLDTSTGLDGSVRRLDGSIRQQDSPSRRVGRPRTQSPVRQRARAGPGASATALAGAPPPAAKGTTPPGGVVIGSSADRLIGSARAPLGSPVLMQSSSQPSPRHGRPLVNQGGYPSTHRPSSAVLVQPPRSYHNAEVSARRSLGSREVQSARADINRMPSPGQRTFNCPAPILMSRQGQPASTPPASVTPKVSPPVSPIRSQPLMPTLQVSLSQKQVEDQQPQEEKTANANMDPESSDFEPLEELASARQSTCSEFSREVSPRESMRQQLSMVAEDDQSFTVASSSVGHSLAQSPRESLKVTPRASANAQSLLQEHYKYSQQSLDSSRILEEVAAAEEAVSAAMTTLVRQNSEPTPLRESSNLAIPSVGLFAGMEERFLELLWSTSKQRIAEAGDVFFAEGERDDRMFIVVQGEVEVIRSVLPGHKPFVRVLRGPTYFGEACALGLRQLRTATVRALTVCQVRALSGEAARGLLRCFPKGSRSILEESKARLAGLAIWEGVSRKRNLELGLGRGSATAGSTTSWSQESSVQVSRRGSMSESSVAVPSSKPSSFPPSKGNSRHGSKSPRSRPHSMQPWLQAKEKTSSSGSTGHSGETGQTGSTPSGAAEGSPREPGETGATSSARGCDDVEYGTPREAQRDHSRRNRKGSPSKKSPKKQEREVERQVDVVDMLVQMQSEPSLQAREDSEESFRESTPIPGIKPWSSKKSSRRSKDKESRDFMASEVPTEFAWAEGLPEETSTAISASHSGRDLRYAGRSREDSPSMSTRMPGMSREDSAVSVDSHSPRSSLTPAASLRLLPSLGASSLTQLPSAHGRPMAGQMPGRSGRKRSLDVHPEDSFDDTSYIRHSSSDGPVSSTSQGSTPVLTPRQDRHRKSSNWSHGNKTRSRKHAPPKPREGWQLSLCEHVIINYPSALPSKDTFVKRKVPRPVSREASPEQRSSAGMSPEPQARVEQESAVGVPKWALPEAAAKSLRESSPPHPESEELPSSSLELGQLQKEKKRAGILTL